MKSVGIRDAKAHLSELARAAANGEPTVITDYGKPLAVIMSIEEAKAAPTAVLSDAAKFRQALLACPGHLEVDF
jgi:prevent-host-death family protein